MPSPGGIRGADYYARILEAIYGALEGRDTTHYQWDDSDRWTQSRTPQVWTRHLECWVDLGGTITYTPPLFRHDCRLVAGLRYRADDDSRSQSRMQAAIRDAIECLLTTPLPDAARVVNVTQATIEGVYEGGWVDVAIGFTLQLPR